MDIERQYNAPNGIYEVLISEETGITEVNIITDTGVETFGTFTSVDDAEEMIKAHIQSSLYELH